MDGNDARPRTEAVQEMRAMWNMEGAMNEQQGDPKAVTNPAIELARLIGGYQISQSIHVAASLGIADHLKDGPVWADVLARATGCHARSLYRLLRALAAAGIFHEGERQDFSLTAMGECLCSDSATPLAPLATFIGRPYMWEAWAHLSHSIRTGENAFRHAHGVSNFEYRSKLSEEEAIFDRAMTANSAGLADAIIAAFDFSQCRLVVDVGGGQGAVLAAVLAAHAELRGILFDQPHVVARAQPVL
jgi:O-methyltransferase domain/Dimerisation domain